MSISNFKPNYNSYYKPYANLDWVSMDTKELYEKNLKEKYELLKLNNWIDNSFTYKFNSHGFRCKEFTDDPTIMFLGCSNTCGIGLPVESIWPELVAKQLNMHCANLGIGGGSHDTAFRLCHGWIDIIKPQIVILLDPPGIRLELIYDVNSHEKSVIMSPSWTNYEGPNKNQIFFLRKWCIDDNNAYFNRLKNTLAIENLCISKNIKFINFTINEYHECAENNDWARDLKHRGVKAHQKFSKYVLTKI
jgi:hypothetical protein